MPTVVWRAVVALTALFALTFIGFPTASEASTGGSGGAYSDATFRSFTAAHGLRGQYHLYAGGIDPRESVGLMVQFHGDGAYEFTNPTSAYSIGGPEGIRVQAARRNMILIVARTPDTQGTPTWWESGSANADYARDLIRSVAYQRYPIDTERVWLNGYSGGAQFITQFLLPKHSSLFGGGGAVIFGGGGVPRVTVQPFAADLRPDYPMHWYTGARDDGTCDSSYNALRDARNGSAYYRNAGFPASLETPAGVCHNLSGRFGPITGQQLALHDSTQTAPSPTPSPSPTATATATPSPSFTAWDHAVTVTRSSATLTVDVPSGTDRTTFRVSRSPFGTQTGYYLYTSRTGEEIQLTLTSVTPATRYYYQVERGTNRTVVGSGTFTTLP